MLCSAVINYLSTVKGMPFFYVVGDEDYGTTLEELRQLGLDIVRVSDFCSKDDKFPNIDDIIDHFRTADVDYKTNKCVLVGLGEYLALRGDQEIRRILGKIKDVTLGNARVVLLLRCVTSQVEEMLNDDIRLHSQQRVYLASSSASSLQIIRIKQDIGLCQNKGIKYLLSAFEDGAKSTQYVDTNLDLGASFLPIKTIEDSYDIIKHIYPSFALTKNMGKPEFWNRLAKDLNRHNNSLSSIFGDMSFYESEFCSRISGLTYDNWLYFVFLVIEKGNLGNKYLQFVIERTDTFEEFRNNVLNGFLEISPCSNLFSTFYNERKRLVRDLPESDVASFVRRTKENSKDAIYYLTDNTLVERQEIIRWVSKNGKTPILETVYPALWLYLERYTFEDCCLAEELTEYFELYKGVKISGIVDDAFYQAVLSQNAAYAMLQTRNNALAKLEHQNKTHLCWIDAMGVEYLSFIQGIAKKKGLSIHVDIARADLPTITRINRGFFDAWPYAKEKIGFLDEVKHKDEGGYIYDPKEKAPIHLARELEIIEQQIENAATLLSLGKCSQFTIISDHGASRPAVLHQQERKYDTDTGGEHSGRCCKIFDGWDIPYAIPEGDYLVLTDYGRFRGSRAANVEVHGGATLEEVVVPVITLSLKNYRPTAKVVDKNNIITDFKNGIVLQIYISNATNLERISLEINGERFIGTMIDEEHFSFHLASLRRAKKYEGKVFDGEDLVGGIEFVARGKTAQMNSDFDELF